MINNITSTSFISHDNSSSPTETSRLIGGNNVEIATNSPHDGESPVSFYGKTGGHKSLPAHQRREQFQQTKASPSENHVIYTGKEKSFLFDLHHEISDQNDSTPIKDDIKTAAQDVCSKSHTNEEKISSALKGIQEKNDNFELEGFKYREKAMGSLCRKIETDTNIELKKGTPREAAVLAAKNGVADALRYTVTASAKNLPEVYQQVEAGLKDAGVSILFKRKNSFDTKDGYHGMNNQYQLVDGSKFEVQFHTPQTYKAKDVSHGFYEKGREESTSAYERTICKAFVNAAYHGSEKPDMSKFPDVLNPTPL